LIEAAVDYLAHRIAAFGGNARIFPDLEGGPEQSTFLDVRRGHPSVDSLFDLDRERYCANATSLPCQIDNHPSLVSQLDVFQRAGGQFFATQGTTHQERNDDVVTLPAITLK
jgi:hypothetical protein